jgi:hypothetical protein
MKVTEMASWGLAKNGRYQVWNIELKIMVTVAFFIS